MGTSNNQYREHDDYNTIIKHSDPSLLKGAVLCLKFWIIVYNEFYEY